MKHVCIQCGLSSRDQNLWCQRPECSANNLNRILSPGERLGTIEIRGLICTLRTAAIYKGRRDDTDVLVKLAHHDSLPFDERSDVITDATPQGIQRLTFSGRLKHESRLLALLNHTVQSGGEVERRITPRLLPPYPHANVNETPYGRVTIGNQMRYYLVMEYVEGQMLGDVLRNITQPDYNYVSLVTLQLANALLILNQVLKISHLGLSPEIVLVRLDGENIPRPLLLDLGFAERIENQRLTGRSLLLDQEVYQKWLSYHLPPAYTAPGLVREGRFDLTTDAYGLGLILYEMLAGHAAYPVQTDNYKTVYRMIEGARYTPLRRRDLTPLSNVAIQALQQGTVRQQTGQNIPRRTVQDIYRELRETFPSIPDERRVYPWWHYRNWTSEEFRTGVLLAGVGVITTLVLLAISYTLDIGII
jgi:serine/threonine protein kinase